jgi:hypothetical protein
VGERLCIGGGLDFFCHQLRSLAEYTIAAYLSIQRALYPLPPVQRKQATALPSNICPSGGKLQFIQTPKALLKPLGTKGIPPCTRPFVGGA